MWAMRSAVEAQAEEVQHRLDGVTGVPDQVAGTRRPRRRAGRPGPGRTGAGCGRTRTAPTPTRASCCSQSKLRISSIVSGRMPCACQRSRDAAGGDVGHDGQVVVAELRQRRPDATLHPPVGPDGPGRHGRAEVVEQLVGPMAVAERLEERVAGAALGRRRRERCRGPSARSGGRRGGRSRCGRRTRASARVPARPCWCRTAARRPGRPASTARPRRRASSATRPCGRPRARARTR